MKPRILVSDSLSEAGLAALERGGLDVHARPGLGADDLRSVIKDYDALVVRSRTVVTPEVLAAAPDLRVVGRAGVGVDNIDLDAATAAGVVVMNAPGGSSITVAEHAFAMLLAAARHTSEGTAGLKAGRWEKKRLAGRQLAGMTLGIVGLGRIGRLVAERARAFEMSVVAFDPFIAPEAAHDLGIELVSLDDLWPRVDAVTLHVPLTDKTHHLVNDETIARMPRGSYVVNCARGGIVDEAALARALSSGHLGGAALDVFEQEPPPADHPLWSVSSFVGTPHLGASTQEAQAAVAVQLADQIVAYFQTGAVANAVNGPSISRAVLEQLGPWLQLAVRMGRLAANLGPLNPTSVTVEAAGDIARHRATPLAGRFLEGLLADASEQLVNAVNAPGIARSRGLKVAERTTDSGADYTSTIALEITAGDTTTRIVGTVFGVRDLRIVRVNEYELDAVPAGHLLILRNDDVPGTVGEVGRVLGAAGINIGRIHLSRSAARRRAFSMINIDSAAPREVLQALRDIPQVLEVRQLHLPDAPGSAPGVSGPSAEA